MAGWDEILKEQWLCCESDWVIINGVVNYAIKSKDAFEDAEWVFNAFMIILRQ